MKIKNQKQLIKTIEKEFPLKSQEPWDFSGFSFVAKKEKDLKILICLDADKKTILRAIEANVSLILSHHPFCFAPSKLEAIKIDQSKRELFTLVNKHNISLYSIHTPFDINKKGTHYYLLKKLELLNKEVKQYQFSAIVKYDSSFESLVNLIKQKLNLNYVASNWTKPTNTKLNKVFFAPGAGDVYDFIKYNKKNSCDMLVTSDIKWNEQVVLQNLGINFLIVSHKVEEVFVDGINEFLQDKIADEIEIILDYGKDNINIF